MSRQLPYRGAFGDRIRQEAVSGSEIVHFELNPGADAEEIVFAVYAVDAKNRTVFKAVHTDLQTVLRAFNEHCSRPPGHGRYSLKDEARRFAAEARIARDDRKFLQAEKLQFAAFALDPDNKDLFDFGTTGDEKLMAAFPYWFAALQRIVRHPEWLKPHEESKSNSIRMIHKIFDNQYELPEKLRREYWNWLSVNRNLWQTGDDVQQFRYVSEEFYPTRAEYLQAKENAWQTLLSKRISPRKMYEAAEELFRYQNSISPALRREWTIGTARQLRGIPGLEIMAKSLECNAFLHTKGCTLDKALEKYEELFAMLKKYPDLQIAPHDLYDHGSVNAYMGLLEKVKSTYKKHRENQS